MPAVGLTSTAACVLGLLQMGPAPGQRGFRQRAPMTGGQVFDAASRSVARFWNLTRSQVYAELPKLERAGLIEPVGEPGPRGAQPYRITDEGRAEFSRWIDEFAQRGPQDDQVRSPLLLSVFFGHFVDRDTLRHLLEEYRGRHRRVLAQVESMLDALGDDRSLPGAALERRVAYERLMVRWIGDVVDRVPSRKPSRRTRRV
jgi:DNA-binding PadR family transcriptional regulator